ncbi:MAG: radical SAM protein [Candidatus Lokiarchaeota archaeon]|nr:radical SAM protein [Candidatus Lokiarchaeota archaeon]
MNRPCIVLFRAAFGPNIPESFRQVNPPIGLGYLASSLEKAGFTTHVIDLSLKNVREDTIQAFLAKKQPLLVGITALTSYYKGMKDLSIFIKERFPNLPVVLGGVHASSLPEECLVECHADFVVRGEGEVTVVELAMELLRPNPDFSKVDGIAFRVDGSTTFTPDRALITNLDDIPFPAWHKINPNHYPRVPHGVVLKHKSFASIISSRGCPFNCAYCASCQFWKQKIRFRSPSNVVDEIQYLHDHFGIEEIHFWDDNLTLNRDHAVGICKEIIRRGLHHMAFGTPNGLRVDTLDEQLLKLMRRAGFYELTFAVESASIKILRSNGKNTDLKKIMWNTVIARKQGFLVNSFFMIGFPEDTAETIEKTIRYAISVPFTYCLFFLLKPLPGSRIFNTWAAGKTLLGYDWDKLTTYTQMNDFILGTLQPAFLFACQKNAFRRKIFRFPGIVEMLLLTIKYFQISQMRNKIASFREFFIKLIS